MSKQIKYVKKVQTKAKQNTVAHFAGSLYQVTSGTSGKQYSVRIHGDCGTCSCDWGKYRPANDQRSGCSHVVSVFEYIADGNGRTVSVWGSDFDAQRQHRPALNIGDGVVLTSRKVA